MTLKINNLTAKIDDNNIVKGIDLELKKGEVAVIMGPNGSGKSTLANAIMGKPGIDITGSVILNDEDITELATEIKSRKGLFLSFQYPVEIPGIKVSHFLRSAINARRDKPMPLPEYIKLLKEKMKMLAVPDDFASRYLNHGFSGGEKKKMEILQLAMLEPKVAILDETDSGLDIDALKSVSQAINTVHKANPNTSILIITHYQRMLNYIKPDSVHIMLDGKIIKTGDASLAQELEEKGYEEYKK